MNTHPFPSLTDTPPKLKTSKVGMEYVELVHKEKEKAKLVAQLLPFFHMNDFFSLDDAKLWRRYEIVSLSTRLANLRPQNITTKFSTHYENNQSTG